MSSEAAQSLEVAELETERLPLSDVSPHSQNPRQHSPEQIKAIEKSLLLDGYIAGSMGIQRSTRTLYKGHGVYMALLNLGTYEADFVVKDLTDAETLALLARDNALSDMSTNDPVKLKAISVELEKMDVKIERMGYNMQQIKNMQPGPSQSPEELWEGMPAFEQEENNGARRIVVHFQTLSDVDKFAELIGQKITDKARYIWFPQQEKLDLRKFAWIDDES